MQNLVTIGSKGAWHPYTVYKLNSFLHKYFIHKSADAVRVSTIRVCIWCDRTADINECAERPTVCRANQECRNTVGSFTCHNLLTCSAGYQLNDDGSRCEGATAKFNNLLSINQLINFYLTKLYIAIGLTLWRVANVAMGGTERLLAASRLPLNHQMVHS